MVKKHYFAGIAGLAAAIALTACHDDIGVRSGSGEGMIAPNVQLDASVVSSTKGQSRASLEDITVNDLQLTLTASDGSYTENWKSVAEFPFENSFPIGNYVLEASYGDVKTEGFECPAFYGSQQITVTENETTNVSLVATVANTMVSVVYTDAFRNYMSDFGSTIHKVGNNNYLFFAENETRPGYLEPGELQLNVSFTKPNGQAASLNVTKFMAQAAHHYTITVNLNNGNGSGNAVLEIMFDDYLAEEMITIDLSDELLNAPAPYINGSEGFVNGALISCVEGDIPNPGIHANIFAKGGLSNLTLIVDSETLRLMGIPKETDLAAADESMQARFRQAGFDIRGVWGQTDATMAVIDFSEAISKLKENAGFTISATDKLGKTTEMPFSFQVKLIPLEAALSNPSSLEIGASELSFDFAFNGSNPQNAQFQMRNERGSWETLKTTSITEKGDGVWRVTVQVPADNKDVTVRSSLSGKNSEAITVERIAPEFAVTYDENDIWATHADLVLTCETADASLLASMATVFVDNGNGTYEAVACKVTGNGLSISGLTPGTTYTALVSLTGNSNDAGAQTVTFTTEAAAAVPNGDFEDLQQTLSESNINQGGKWSISWGIDYQSYAGYSIKEPVGWASVNKKTTSGSTRNTWFVIPSTFNSTVEYSSTVPKIKVIGTGGGTETPNAYKNFTVKSGSNAMVIRNVGWDANGSVPGTWLKTGIKAIDYYNHTVPNVANASAGKLFLGSYSYQNGEESYNEGAEFTSRPSALKGFYTYSCDSKDASEKATVKVEVLSGNTVIANGTASLGASGNYSEFNVSLKYINKAPKATQIRIMICSSDKSNESEISLSDYNSRYEGYKIGATLTVDNLTFAY